jgi:hypothetical protein
MPFITDERLAELERAHKTLDVIGTMSPAVTRPATGDMRRCILCAVHINEAREALGYQALPEIARTPKAQE